MFEPWDDGVEIKPIKAIVIVKKGTQEVVCAMEAQADGLFVLSEGLDALMTFEGDDEIEIRYEEKPDGTTYARYHFNTDLRDPNFL